MKVVDSLETTAATLLARTSLTLVSLQKLQRLWAGYGSICRITASPTTPNDMDHVQHESLILKYIAPPPAARSSDEGHIRKVLSYHVEQYFYSHLAGQLPPEIPVAKCLASIQSDSNSGGKDVTAMLLTDLRLEYPLAGEKMGKLSEVQTQAALKWLASFHGFWWARVGALERVRLVKPPLEEIRKARGALKKSVWLNGGYTYLETRCKEYRDLVNDEDSEWCEVLCATVGNSLSIAERVAKVLAPRSEGIGISAEFETLVHGDVKSENLFTTRSGAGAVFYDFQYVGLGLGICDLAKFFTCSVPLWMLVDDQYVPDELEMRVGEERLLRIYQQILQEYSGKKYPWEELIKHWETALVDWLRFQASWGSWGNFQWLEARARFILKDPGWKNWLDQHTS
ncbi:kinase-like domain-containing protein [Calycina marina]|uniref:Kinase-like domain-containing protein n=1 Tax=Calycina marina TaxID=1763456 RepID=A0A9P8CHI0_9HELO|nr:kinase-like domain-containing protein [Calycina marina]